MPGIMPSDRLQGICSYFIPSGKLFDFEIPLNCHFVFHPKMRRMRFVIRTTPYPITMNTSRAKKTNGYFIPDSIQIERETTRWRSRERLKAHRRPAAKPRVDDQPVPRLWALLPDKGNILDIMPKEGIEPSYPYGYTILSRARLPVPPLRPEHKFYHIKR